MKYFGWSLTRALSHTKERRGIINPNAGFREQLKIYEGILEASRQRNSFKEIKRSKSEGSMMKKSPTLLRIRRGSRKGRGHSRQGSAGVEVGSEEGQGKHRRASSWSPAQLADEDEGGRRHLGTSSPPSPHHPRPPSSTTATPPWPPCSPPHPPPPPPQHSPPPPIPRPSGQTSTPCLVFVGTRAMRRRRRKRWRRGWMKGKRPKES